METPEQDDNNRKFTDADIKAFVIQIKQAMIEDFYAQLGHGLWSSAIKVLVLGLLGLLLWSISKGYKL
ncbi:MAG: hypothetical protein RL748_4308 [Pseudomonadota bacterium]